jgi:hypothetical protein
VDHVDVFPELAAEPSRHPGGVKSGDSVGAVADGDPCQWVPPRVVPVRLEERPSTRKWGPPSPPNALVHSPECEGGEP